MYRYLDFEAQRISLFIYMSAVTLLDSLRRQFFAPLLPHFPLDRRFFRLPRFTRRPSTRRGWSGRPRRTTSSPMRTVRYRNKKKTLKKNVFRNNMCFFFSQKNKTCVFSFKKKNAVFVFSFREKHGYFFLNVASF